MTFTSANAISTLLTTESLLFAVFALALSFPSSPLARTAVSGRQIVFWAAALVTLVASGAAVAWLNLFLAHWPARFGTWFPAVAIAGGIIAQPGFVWVFVIKLSHKPTPGRTDQPQPRR